MASDDASNPQKKTRAVPGATLESVAATIREKITVNLNAGGTPISVSATANVKKDEIEAAARACVEATRKHPRTEFEGWRDRYVVAQKKSLPEYMEKHKKYCDMVEAKHLEITTKIIRDHVTRQQMLQHNPSVRTNIRR